MGSGKERLKALLEKADITIDGTKPWDIQIHNDKIYQRVLAEGSLGFGEGYMDGWWDVKELDQFIEKIFSSNIYDDTYKFSLMFDFVKAKMMNMQTLKRSKKVAKEHYDLGNNFYEHMLDKRMQYTCAYWKDAKTLDQAQENKLHLICKKLQLKKGEKVLELGCGWGGFAKFAAENYGVSVVAYNISKEQVEYARKINNGLDVEIVHADYREATGKFDKVASIGLCEHVGYKNYRGLMELAHKCLKNRGLFLLHTIGHYKNVTKCDPWVDKYIFPNGMLPSPEQLGRAMNEIFILEDWHNFGPDYDKTLMAWFDNFDKNWAKFREKYGDRFYKMWKFYLLSFAGNFRARKIELYQLVLSKNGILGGYSSVR